MIRFTLASILLTASSALAAPVPKEVLKSDKLEGLWEITLMELLGQPRVGPKQRWRFGGDSIVVEQIVPNAAARIRPAIVIKVDPAASPKALDYNLKGPLPRLAIYEVDGDTLKILMATQRTERPKEMKPDDSTVLYVFKRVKE